MFEIKGAPCTQCAHFGCRAHRFLDLFTRCVHVFFLTYQYLYIKKNDKLPGARFWLPVHPAGAQYKTFISNTGYDWIVKKNFSLDILKIPDLVNAKSCILAINWHKSQLQKP